MLHVLLKFSKHTPLHRLGSQIIKCSCSNGATVIGEFPPGFKEVKTTVSSLRIDNIASAGLNISRRLSINYIAIKHHMLVGSPYDTAIGGAFNRVMWERFIDGQVLHNGKVAKKKSTIVSVAD